MASFRTHSFPAAGVRSLSWRGDELVDWVGGGRAFALDGSHQNPRVHYAYRFNAVTTSPDGRYAVLHERTGTKALLLKDGKIVRELNRSYYQAEAYEYPITFLPAQGRLMLAHCPDHYNQIEFEDVETGHRLPASDQRKPADFFHSRLSASPGGKRLMSAGWVWHPWSAVCTFDVARALHDPQVLDRGDHVGPSAAVEVGSACWLDDDRIVVGASSEDDPLDEDEDAELGLKPKGVAVFDLTNGQCLSSIQRHEAPGTMFAISDRIVLALYGHPKLIDLQTGEILQAWPELTSGRQDSSIIRHLKDDARPPPMAFDPLTKRFAIANGDTVTVIEFR